MIGICGVLLVLFVLRPVASQVTATLREPMLLPAGTSAAGAFEERNAATSDWDDRLESCTATTDEQDASTAAGNLRTCF